MFLAKSETPRNVAEDGSRFWILQDEDLASQPFGLDTAGIVDEEQGGIVAYVHIDNAPRTLQAFRAFTEEL